MKKTLLLSAFLLSVSLACFVTEVVTPPPAIPTFDPNAIPTMVAQTAQALALSATATQTVPPSETPGEPPAFTFTATMTPSPTLLTFTPGATNIAAPSPSPAATVIYVPVTTTPPPPSQASASPTKPAPSVTHTPLPPSATITLPPPSATFTLPPPPAAPTSTTVAANTPTFTPVSVCPQANIQFEARVIELINIERANAGLPALNDNPQLTAAAQLHSADMACNNYFSHTGRDGSSFSDRAKRQGYDMSYGGENIAAGYGSPEQAVKGWMNSEGHRANILGANYADIGVGYAYDKNSAYGHYWTAVFGSR